MFFCAFALAVARRRAPLRQALRSARPGLQVVRSLALLGDMLLFVVAVGLLPLADTHALIATFPLMVTALSPLLLGEAVGLRRWLAVGAGFVGVLLILRPGLSVLQPGSLPALAAAFFFALYTILTRKVGRHDPPEVSLAYIGIVGIVLMTFIGPFFWQPPTLKSWALLALIGVMAAFAHLLLIEALKVAPASLLQPFNYLFVLEATVLGYLVFGQFPDRWTIAGAAIVVASGLYVIHREYRLRRRPPNR